MTLSTDHPRSRGVYARAVALVGRAFGSSPLARGLRRRAGPPRGPARIIPARAGFTSYTEPGDPRPEDHPRSRGVYSTSTASGAPGPGSSPLARGLLGAGPPRRRRRRIIPARAGFTARAAVKADGGPDHPRSRGVYPPSPRPPTRASGSSPLARGLRAHELAAWQRVRIIPARAGFTPSSRWRRRGSRDHPRSRGVYRSRACASACPMGSSPLARGLRSPVKARCTRQRIIPARAGFTPPPRRASGRCPDHPRSRGVYPTPTCPPGTTGGSSPLARGLPAHPDARVVHGRIIPARAGFTPGGGEPASARADHPRSRGVYPLMPGRLRGVGGSSPLARGLRASGRSRWGSRRIIPARAGFTHGIQAAGRRHADHPRSRGVYAPGFTIERDDFGSSPLARGLRTAPAPDRRPGGIIPARAGFTTPAISPWPCTTDHPRSRGVYSTWTDRPATGCGSSPLARGLPLDAAPGLPHSGIIPARAGFTTISPHGRDARPDHPRSRGVYDPGDRPDPVRPGSSPLARGLQELLVARAVLPRISPARAGFTGPLHQGDLPAADHPRSRGVYAPNRRGGVTAVGSSPLARGLRGPRTQCAPNQRIIPARAGFTSSHEAEEDPGQDHPRSRGVYARTVARPARSSGSSPLARGLHVGDADGHPGRRIIPARAGFTTSLAGADPSAEDHPRSRGVYAPVTIQVTGAAGSSPLARGLRPRPADPDAHARIIPARAGFTSSPGAVGSSLSDHPRSRGVYLLLGVLGAVAEGSSPLARGLLQRVCAPAWIPVDHPRSRGVYSRPAAPRRPRTGSSPLARGLRRASTRKPDGPRIIPARAGFTRLSTGRSPVRWDHPRSRGVYQPAWASPIPPRGSSPLARGLRVEGVHDLLGGRIIPARAGFTATGSTTRCPAGDHPRSRGVYTAASATPTSTRGSSPLARGLRGHRLPLLGRLRIIPARAGFTLERHPTGRAGRDHPRSRGVYSWRPTAMAVWRGSSPLARGLLGADQSWTTPARIIPARAGFTAAPLPRCPAGADHPRSRGVYRRGGWCGSTRWGSSPLARGLLTGDPTDRRIRRIIPARAGFTPDSRLRQWWRPDHPRSRGVYVALPANDRIRSGSSPLARGLRVAGGQARAGLRIIPARAGFTCPRSPTTTRAPGSSPLARGLRTRLSPRPMTVGIIPARAGFTQKTHSMLNTAPDHPRSRGVYAAIFAPSEAGGGSSPLARGLPASWFQFSVVSWIIPARAGFTV